MCMSIYIYIHIIYIYIYIQLMYLILTKNKGVFYKLCTHMPKLTLLLYEIRDT